MKTSNLRRRLGTGLLILHLAWVQIISGLGVLCVGDDGHVAFEIAAGYSCGDGELEESHSAEPTFSRTAHCGPCTDFLFDDSQLTSSSKSRMVGPPSLLLLFPNDPPNAASGAPQTALQTSPRSAAGTLRLLSVQLLC